MSEPLYPVTPFQPTLPPEGDFTDAELTFMDESPPGLFPENQDSNFGWIIRRVFSNFIQDLIDLQQTLYNERFVPTSTEYLDQWEIEVGLPPNPTNISIAQQRQAVLAHLAHGPFTRTRRDDVIRRYIVATFGSPIILVPEGVALVPEGIPLYSEAAGVENLFRVVEDQPNFHYTVTVSTAVDPNMTSMGRELKRITPCGISFDFVRAELFITYEQRMMKYGTYQDVIDTGKSYHDISVGG